MILLFWTCPYPKSHIPSWYDLNRVGATIYVDICAQKTRKQVDSLV